MITVDLIMQGVAEYFGIPLDVLMSANREVRTVEARGIASYLSRQLTTASFAEIGRLMGGRDHTTVLAGARKVNEALQTDPDTLKHVRDIRYIVQTAATALTRIGIAAPQSIDPLIVANRLLNEPLTRLQISVEELKILAYAVINLQAALQRKVEFSEELVGTIGAARDQAEAVIIAFDRWQSDRFSVAEKTATAELDRTLTEFKKTLKMEDSVL